MDARPGSLVWRSLTVEDAGVSAELLNAMERTDGIGEYYTAEDTRQELVDPYLDLEQATLGAFDGPLMIGFMKVAWKREAESLHRVTVDGGVHPDYRRQGVGARLIADGIAAAQRLHALHHPDLPLAIDVQKGDRVPGCAELFAASGFTPVATYEHCEHDLAYLPVPAVPSGMVVEPWSAENDEHFRVVRNESFRDHLEGMAPMPPDNWRNRMTDHTFQPALSFLVRDADGTPAGMLLTKHWAADTEVTGIRDAHVLLVGTLRPYRGRGAASALVARALRAAADHGFDRVSTRADSAGGPGTPNLFARLGFVATQRHIRWSRPGEVR